VHLWRRRLPVSARIPQSQKEPVQMKSPHPSPGGCCIVKVAANEVQQRVQRQVSQRCFFEFPFLGKGRWNRRRVGWLATCTYEETPSWLPQSECGLSVLDCGECHMQRTVSSPLMNHLGDGWQKWHWPDEHFAVTIKGCCCLSMTKHPWRLSLYSQPRGRFFQAQQVKLTRRFGQGPRVLIRYSYLL